MDTAAVLSIFLLTTSPVTVRRACCSLASFPACSLIIQSQVFWLLSCSRMTVLIRAIFRRTFLNWSDRTSCPVARCIRKLNCSRRNPSSSSINSSRFLSRSSFAFIKSPVAKQMLSKPATSPRRGERPPARWTRKPLPFHTALDQVEFARPSIRRCPCLYPDELPVASS